jgi:hypothetical protein
MSSQKEAVDLINRAKLTKEQAPPNIMRGEFDRQKESISKND